MPQVLRKNILIICEGSTTEPNYFDNLRDLVLKESQHYYIKIRPLPESDKLKLTEVKPSSDRQGRRSRQLKDVVVKEEPTPEEYSAQPIRYVWEAQQGLVDDTFDESWAVFDLDEHPKQKEAFELSEKVINGKRVQIAFSSISFETWILMHYECNSTAFTKSQCRTKKEPHYCGQGFHKDDCQGQLCVTGYLKHMNFIDKKRDVKHINFIDLREKTAVALKNSILLRSNIPAGQAIYTINPITTVDRLVFKLLNSAFDFQWTDVGSIKIHGLKTTVSRKNNLLQIVVSNTTHTTFVLLPSHLLLFDSFGRSRPFGVREVIYPQTSSTSQILDLTTVTDFEATYLFFEIKDGVNGITEIPQ